MLEAEPTRSTLLIVRDIDKPPSVGRAKGEATRIAHAASLCHPPARQIGIIWIFHSTKNGYPAGRPASELRRD